MKRERETFQHYLTALEEVLKNDDHNKGFHVDRPDTFTQKRYAQEVDALLEKEGKYRPFFDLVGAYFDAKSHYAAEINGKRIEAVKSDIEKQIFEIRSIENI